MQETPALEGKKQALKLHLITALQGTGLHLLAVPGNGAISGMVQLSCNKRHQFLRNASSILKWRSSRCPVCYSTATVEKKKRKLRDPNCLEWIPSGISLGKGTKPRDLREQRFGCLVSRRVVGKHPSGSLLWECQCDCGRVVLKKSSSLSSGKVKSCGCVPGTAKKYRTIAPNKGKRYTLKTLHEVFSSRKAWAEAVKLVQGDKCAICGWHEASCDVHHLVERHNGGKNTVENAIVLCPNHHRTAHERGLEHLLQLKEKAAQLVKVPDFSLRQTDESVRD